MNVITVTVAAERLREEPSDTHLAQLERALADLPPTKEVQELREHIAIRRGYLEIQLPSLAVEHLNKVLRDWEGYSLDVFDEAVSRYQRLVSGYKSSLIVYASFVQRPDLADAALPLLHSVNAYAHLGRTGQGPRIAQDMRDARQELESRVVRAACAGIADFADALPPQ